MENFNNKDIPSVYKNQPISRAEAYNQKIFTPIV